MTIKKKFFPLLNFIFLIIALCFFKKELLPQWEAKHFALLFFIFVPPLFFIPYFAMASFFPFCEKRLSDFLILGLISCAVSMKILINLRWLIPQFILLLWVVVFLVCLWKKSQFFPLIQQEGKAFFYAIWKLNPFVFSLFIFFLIHLLYTLTVGQISGGGLYPELETDHALIHHTIMKYALDYHGFVNTWWLRLPFLPQLYHAIQIGMISVLNFFHIRGDLVPALLGINLVFISQVLVFDYFKNIVVPILWGLFILLFPVVRWSLGTSYLDIPNAFFIFVSILEYIRFHRENNLKSLTKSFIYMVTAFCIKPFAATLLLPIALIWAIDLSQKGFRPFWQAFRAALVPSLVVFFSTTFSNILLSKNPVFPFLYASWPNQFFFDKASVDSLKEAIGHWSIPWEWSSIFKIWPRFIFQSETFTDTSSFNLIDYLPWWIFLSFFLAIFAVIKRHWSSLILFFLTFIQIYMWGFSSAILRYLLPFIFCWGFFLIDIFFKMKRPKYFHHAAIGIFIFFNLIEVKNIVTYIFDAPPLNRLEVEKFYTKHVPNFKAAQFVNQNTPAGSVIYTFLTQETWPYLMRPFLGDWFGIGVYDEFAHPSPQKLVERYAYLGIDYILMPKNHPMIELHSLKFPEPIKGYEGCFELIYQDENSFLYHFLRKNSEVCPVAKQSLFEGYQSLVRFPSKNEIPFWPPSV